MGGPLRTTVRAIVVGNPPDAILGLSYEGGIVKAFSEIRPWVDKRAMVHTARMFMAMVKNLGIRPIAVADPAKPATGRRLQRLGFERIGTTENGDIYR